MKIHQYFTPGWVPELLLQRHYPDITGADVVADLTCGDGRFLMAVPAHCDAFGVDIDLAAVEQARANNPGRQVLHCDFRLADFPARPSIVVGNPPFQGEIINALLDRCFEEMEYGGRVGLILPVYFFQQASTVAKLARRWSMAQELIPRNLFEGLSKPILFATMTKARQTVVAGFYLYQEVHSIAGLRKMFRTMFLGNGARASVWRETCHAAMKICGGRATLPQIYECLEQHRPTENPFWREKIRQTMAREFVRVAPGEYMEAECTS